MDKSTWLPLLLAIGAGGLMALQPAANRALAAQCSHPLQASIISFATGLGALVIVATYLQVGIPTWTRLGTLPVWAWTGGLIGTYMVTVSLLIAPQMGAVRWIALVLAGQIGLSLVLDHFGWIGYSQHPINFARLFGIACLVLGVHLILRN